MLIFSMLQLLMMKLAVQMMPRTRRVSRLPNLLSLMVLFSVLCGCDTVHYNLRGTVYSVSNGVKAPTSDARVTLTCPSLLLKSKETRTDNAGFYVLMGKGVLQRLCSFGGES